MEKNVDGLIKSMNSITTSFSTFKLIVLASLVGAFAVCVFSVWYTTSKYEEFTRQVYILDNGQSFSAVMQDASFTREDEVRVFVTHFHELFFNIPPDMSMIRKNLEKALAMSDKSAYQYYLDLTENGFYKRMSASDSYQQIEVDEVQINMSVYPYEVVTKCTQWITRESNMSKYSLVTSCRLTNIPRSPKNMNGLMIQNFSVLENNKLETRNR